MKKIIKIDIIELGDTYPLNTQRIKHFAQKSVIFKIEDILKNVNADLLNKEEACLADKDFDLFTTRKTDADFSVIIVSRRLEGNYFSRVLTEKLIVVSIFEMEILHMHEGISLEMYLIRFLLAFATIFKAYDGLSSRAVELMQVNPTGCLFDKSVYKPQIALFFREPKLSSSALGILEKKTLSRSFLNSLQNEMRDLKISRYYSIKDWFKANPIKAIFITFFFGLICSELLGNYLYDLIHDFLPCLKDENPTRS